MSTQLKTATAVVLVYAAWAYGPSWSKVIACFKMHAPAPPQCS